MIDQAHSTLSELKGILQDEFKTRRTIMGFEEYLNIVRAKPSLHTRSSARYLLDTINYFGKDVFKSQYGSSERLKLFDLKTSQAGPIVGGEEVQAEIYRTLENFDSLGYANKLILLHGPNGSAKSSTVEMLVNGMEQYCRTEEGAVYSFNWIFPTERSSQSTLASDRGSIGFAGARQEEETLRFSTYAHLDELKIASKIQSEFHDNPIFLIPALKREDLLREWFANTKNTSRDKVDLPAHILGAGLSKKNQLIFENLLLAYEGDFEKVMRHVQVERFYYSKSYRVGISTVEPQMSIDAADKQLTMDKNIQNLPAYLHNMRFFESFGPLVEANRGLLEFSDMLKRPAETFKYLLTTVEKRTVQLSSSTANLDLIFFATTNDKHLDAFSASPDFSSFRSRFELVTVPYLLTPSLEEKIYARDVDIIRKTKNVAPHTVSCLAKWAVLTRLKQADRALYDKKHQGALAKLTPWVKLKLYDARSLQPETTVQEESYLLEIKSLIRAESKGAHIYEGRFGASPREVRSLLYKASQARGTKPVTPMAVFRELRELVRNKTVYEFLQYENRAGFHDAESFIGMVEKDFCDAFEHELLVAMNFVSEGEYDKHFTRYIDHVVASIKKEKIYSTQTGTHEEPSIALMNDIERILGISGSIDRHRQNLLARIAAFKIDHPGRKIVFNEIFADEMRKIQNHYYFEKRSKVDALAEKMLILKSDSETSKGVSSLTDSEIAEAKEVFERLNSRFGYDEISSVDCLKFVWNKRFSKNRVNADQEDQAKKEEQEDPTTGQG